MANKLASAISDRYSPRAFSENPVTDSQIKLLFEAARWAPSAFNEQPWRFVYAKKADKAEFDVLLSCLVDANQKWAWSANILIMTLAKDSFTHNDKKNSYSWHDVGLAVGNLLTQTTTLGLKAHQMAGFKAETAIEKLNIPNGFTPVTFIAIGNEGDLSILPEDIQEMEKGKVRNRKELDELVFKGCWT